MQEKCSHINSIIMRRFTEDFFFLKEFADFLVYHLKVLSHNYYYFFPPFPTIHVICFEIIQVANTSKLKDTTYWSRNHLHQGVGKFFDTPSVCSVQ